MWTPLLSAFIFPFNPTRKEILIHLKFEKGPRWIYTYPSGTYKDHASSRNYPIHWSQISHQVLQDSLAGQGVRNKYGTLPWKCVTDGGWWLVNIQRWSRLSGVKFQRMDDGGSYESWEWGSDFNVTRSAFSRTLSLPFHFFRTTSLYPLFHKCYTSVLDLRALQGKNFF